MVFYIFFPPTAFGFLVLIKCLGKTENLQSTVVPTAHSLNFHRAYLRCAQSSAHSAAIGSPVQRFYLILFVKLAIKLTSSTKMLKQFREDWSAGSEVTKAI
jgi:hypothetical protein